MTDDRRILRRDQPVNPRTRITRTQFYQHRDGMHHVAERGRLDQQNARELGSLKPEPVLVLNLCVFDLPIQFAKDKSARVMPLVKLRSLRTIVISSPLPLSKGRGARQGIQITSAPAPTKIQSYLTDRPSSSPSPSKGEATRA